MESVLPLSACSFSSRALAATSNEFAVPVGLPMRGGDGHLKKAGLNAKKQLRESSAIMYGSQETNVLCGSAGSDVRKKNPYVLKSLGNIAFYCGSSKMLSSQAAPLRMKGSRNALPPALGAGFSDKYKAPRVKGNELKRNSEWRLCQRCLLFRSQAYWNTSYGYPKAINFTPQT
eukprot:CAMPEP_0172774756 /NCGR_PEP_ID=MMETSP1074-20121228/196733_1 /TAXON_ID=2916 /ORGANISM="Ceratium fusus, Strain PA161109" /LENGTH=173 /DNA_ID=CAMNT_0013611253 /DNA_START=128 /DNA_END=650 /DNA_ORIENTATION=+